MTEQEMLIARIKSYINTNAHWESHTFVIQVMRFSLISLEGNHAAIVAAAEKLVRCKGRYHSEQNYRALAQLFGVTVPDLEPLAGDGWIKCTERFPEVGAKVLIRIPVVDHFNIENGMYKGDGKFIGAWCSTRGEGCAYDVTHWQPLPPPPGSDRG